MRNRIWQKLGTGSRKSGLKEGVDQAADSKLGGNRLRLVQRILETSTGHRVEWKHMVLLHLTSPTLPQFYICNSGIRFWFVEIEAKTALGWKFQAFPHLQPRPFTHCPAPSRSWIPTEFTGSSGWVHPGLKTINYLRGTWRHQQPQKLDWELQTSREGLHGGGHEFSRLTPTMTKYWHSQTRIILRTFRLWLTNMRLACTWCNDLSHQSALPCSNTCWQSVRASGVCPTFNQLKEPSVSGVNCSFLKASRSRLSDLPLTRSFYSLQFIGICPENHGKLIKLQQHNSARINAFVWWRHRGQPQITGATAGVSDFCCYATIDQ